MATARLVASTYTVSNANYVVVTDPNEYLYENTSNTAGYASVRGRGGRSSNSTYYCYLHGFNFGSIPSNATVSAFSVKIKGYRNSYQNTGSSYRVRLCGSATNSAIASTTASTDWDTTTQTITIPTGSLSWSDITGYGSGFSIQLRLRNTSNTSSNYPYLYIYGAEIEVTYTVPTTSYTVSASSTDATLTVTVKDQGTSQDIPAGEPVDIYIDGSDFTGLHATDNGVDVTSSLVYVPESTDYPAYYKYEIAAVNEAHTIVVSRVVTMPVRVKQNGSWVTPTKIMVKQNGSWVQGTIKVKDNGTWK